MLFQFPGRNQPGPAKSVPDPGPIARQRNHRADMRNWALNWRRMFGPHAPKECEWGKSISLSFATWYRDMSQAGPQNNLNPPNPSTP
jgi:hypothetical protein